jgi:D-alanine-D-alanine ligase
MNKTSKIIVLAGGFSDEREVSLRSGRNVYEALLRLGYNNTEFMDLDSPDKLAEIIKRREEIKLVALLTHGTYGEDGCIQGFLELAKIPYTGSNVLTSAICMNKVRTKEILAAHKLPVLQTYLAKEVYAGKSDLVEAAEIIFKPSVGGSSVGICKFNNLAELRKFIDTNSQAREEMDSYLIERFVRGTEVTTSIIEARSERITENLEHCKTFSREAKNLISLPILELRPKNEFYDYEAKYTEGMTEFVLPAQIEESVEAKIHNYALEAFYRLDCKGAARVDFMIDGKTKQPYILEVNTLPGMTNTSDLPAQAKAAGISYDELVEIIIQSSCS